MYDVLIVGAGTAGMTAAIYALRAKKSVLLLESVTPGGQIINTHKIDNYPAAPGVSGVEFANTLKSQVESFGGEFEFARVEKIEEKDGIFEVSTDDEDLGLLRAYSVILANGSAERKLGLENEEKYIGRGISYCATRDGNFFKDKTIAIYGGGNTAVYSALYLANLAKKVYLITRSDFRAEKSLVEKISAVENAELLRGTTVIALSGEKKLESITLSSKSGEETLAVDGLFVSIGRVPDNSAFKDFIELDESGYIKSDETCKTSRKGVFCAGDTRTKLLHQLVTATSDGAIAATNAIEYLNS
ncbi:FAD-dependent oxidoreductase [Candidatus Saccharibacteria bacterium]|nr:FAD-dependent oxidoreductase [Candidatus Saccharibacteria bacterium]